MYYKLSDFISDWEFEKEATLKLLRVLSDESLKQKVNEQGRSLGQLAWHITTSLGEMTSRTGIKIIAPSDNTDAPESAKEIEETYQSVSGTLMNELKETWNDDTLQTEDEMFGQKWKRGMTLDVLITHQIHHRGQITVLMRQAGLKVPGIYGPAYEEWAAYGMEPMK